MQFNFRFQKILELIENEKDFAQIQVADAIKHHEAGHQKKESVSSKMFELEQLKKVKQQNGMNISELRMLENYTKQLQDLLASSDHELEQLESNVSKTQSYLQEKAQEEKTWENLKQQQRILFEEQKKVEEQNFFDELATIRFYRLTQASIAERG